MVVANQISDENFAFNSDFNEVVIITKDKVIKTEKLSKYEIANKILDSVLEKI